MFDIDKLNVGNVKGTNDEKIDHTVSFDWVPPGITPDVVSILIFCLFVRR
jgi:hypothetical protein